MFVDSDRTNIPKLQVHLLVEMQHHMEDLLPPGERCVSHKRVFCFQCESSRVTLACATQRAGLECSSWLGDRFATTPAQQPRTLLLPRVVVLLAPVLRLRLPPTRTLSVLQGRR
jgi:hypothetical protein